MSENDNSWKSSLRDGESLRTPYKSPYVKNRISRSPQKNTESKDYNHWDFYRKINQVENESCIIADPFKPTKNLWIKKDCDTKEIQDMQNKKPN